LRSACRRRAELFKFEEESGRRGKLYGMDQENTKPFAQTCLAARRMVEGGVRFIQVFHGYDGRPGPDAGGPGPATPSSRPVDKPIAASSRTQAGGL
jgi:hypothetical protein